MQFSSPFGVPRTWTACSDDGAVQARIFEVMQRDLFAGAAPSVCWYSVTVFLFDRFGAIVSSANKRVHSISKAKECALRLEEQLRRLSTADPSTSKGSETATGDAHREEFV